MISITHEELKNYLGIEVLPENADKLILISETLVNHAIFKNYSGTVTEATAIKHAICAQFEYLHLEGLGNNEIKSYTNDDVSITYTDSKGQKGLLCTTAQIFLNSKGLLFRGGI